MSVITAFGRWRQEGEKFEDSLGYMRSCLKNKQKSKPSNLLIRHSNLKTKDQN